MLGERAGFYFRERRRARERRRWRAAWIKGLYRRTRRGRICLAAGRLFRLCLAGLLLWEAAWFAGNSLEWSERLEQTAGDGREELKRGFWLRLKEGEAGFFEVLEYSQPDSD